MATGEFSVYHWGVDGSYVAEVKYVDGETAVNKAKFLTTNVAGRCGLTTKVMITDGGDCAVFIWEYGKGITHGGPEET
jgi:hypothetical protein